MRVLVAWEQGLNAGHSLRLAHILQLLKAKQTHATFVHARGLAGEFIASSITCDRIELRTSNPSAQWRPPERLASFVDVLAAQRWTDTQWLTESLREWVHHLQQHKPDCLILDYAPVAKLAAWAMGIPCLHISSGFDAPPAHCPPFAAPGSSGFGIPVSQNLEVVEDCIAQALAGAGFPRRRPALSTVLGYGRTLLDCVPETDPYGPRREGVYAQFLPPAGALTPPQWGPPPNGEGEDRVFAYVRDDAVAQSLLEIFGERKLATLLVWPGYDPRKHGGSLRFTHVSRSLVDINDFADNLKLIINYGSVGLATHAVLAGVPQLLIPTDAEKLMVARRVAGCGLGLIVLGAGHDRRVGELDESLRFLLSDPSIAERCRAHRKEDSWTRSCFDQLFYAALTNSVTKDS